jgi:hypothetical protein
VQTYKEKTKMIPASLHHLLHFHVLSDMLHSQVEKCMMGRVEKGGGEKGGGKRRGGAHVHIGIQDKAMQANAYAACLLVSMQKWGGRGGGDF